MFWKKAKQSQSTEKITKLSTKGEALLKSGNYKQALKHYTQVSELCPTDVNILLNRAFCLMGLSRFGDAIDCLDGILKLDPNHDEALVNKATTLRFLNRKEEAIACCERALEINPSSRAAWDIKGMILYFSDRFNEALPCLEKAAEMGFPTAREAVLACRSKIAEQA